MKKDAQKQTNEMRFYCRALQGNSGYNICINSDMTVSCNCQDYDGAGIIGDLSVQSFEEIFYGEKAQSFRKSLSEGVLPISICEHCNELREFEGEDPTILLKNFKPPTIGIMVENTSNCNLHCKVCRREQLQKTRKKMQLSLDDIRVIAMIIKRCGIKRVCYFNLGEPFLSKNVHEEISILKEMNPDLAIYTSTNGMLLDDENKIRAALLMDLIFFSIDGASQEVVVQYQVGGNFKKSYDNMKELVRKRDLTGAKTPVIEWKYVVFRWNDSVNEIEKAIALAKDAGVDIISFWRGGGPKMVSKRYRQDPYFQNLGVESWKGREIRFRNEPVGKGPNF